MHYFGKILRLLSVVTGGRAASVLFALGSKFRPSMDSCVLRRLQPINQCYGNPTWEITQMFVEGHAHPSEHTAVAVNRFEEEKGRLNFENSRDGMRQFLSWLKTIDGIAQNVVIGIEGRGGKGSAFIASMLEKYEHVYEVNPQYTRQRRQFGTRGGKSAGCQEAIARLYRLACQVEYAAQEASRQQRQVVFLLKHH